MRRIRVFFLTLIISSLISTGGAFADNKGRSEKDSSKRFHLDLLQPGSNAASRIDYAQSRTFGIAATPDKPSHPEIPAEAATDDPKPGAEKVPDEGPFYPGFGKFHKALAYNFTRGLLSKGNLLPLLIGSAGALTAYPFDEEVSDAMWGSAPAWGDIGFALGGQWAILGSTGAILAITPLIENKRFRGFSFTLAQAIILNNVLTFSLKAAVSRTRPNEENDYSFPSGHASNTFAWSTVAANYYGWKVGIPAYAVAGFVALSRVEKGAHYLSDVIAGSTLGFISGITAVRGSKHFGGKRKWTLVPSFDSQHKALCFHMSF